MGEKVISRAVIKRLPKYYRYLGDLLDNDVERISSSELSRQMHFTASQIRQDLNNFGGFGQQGYGYNVRKLRDEIGKILGLDTTHNMIIVGVGHLGQALANYTNFERSGFKLVGLFDVNPALEGKQIRGVRVLMLKELPIFLRNTHVDIAALTIPKDQARKVAEMLTDNGVPALWNFAYTDLSFLRSQGVVIENVHLSESLMRLSYNLTRHEDGEEND